VQRLCSSVAAIRTPLALQISENVRNGAVADAVSAGGHSSMGHLCPRMTLNRTLWKQRATSINTRRLIIMIYFERKVVLIIGI
jgi:hypothetical protein